MVVIRFILPAVQWLWSWLPLALAPPVHSHVHHHHHGDDKPLDKAFLLWNSPDMEWEVEYSDEFEGWWNSLSEAEQEDVSAVVGVLQDKGPSLRRPHVGPIATSRHPNMKELLIQHAGRPYRVLFAFDPRRYAILLIGGDKTGNARWYEEFVPKADDLYDGHLAQLRREGKI